MDISIAEAKLELALLNANSTKMDRIDMFAELTNMGLPAELVFRLEELWQSTKVIGGKVIHIGRIILAEIIRFIKNNPKLSAGVALGAAVGSLVSVVPLIGPLLAPLSIVTGATLGGLAGMKIDRDGLVEDGLLGVAQEYIMLADKFFELLNAIFNALTTEFK